MSHRRLGVLPSGYFMYISTSSFPFKYAPSTSVWRISRLWVDDGANRIGNDVKQSTGAYVSSKSTPGTLCDQPGLELDHLSRLRPP